MYSLCSFLSVGKNSHFYRLVHISCTVNKRSTFTQADRLSLPINNTIYDLTLFRGGLAEINVIFSMLS